MGWLLVQMRLRLMLLLFMLGHAARKGSAHFSNVLVRLLVQVLLVRLPQRLLMWLVWGWMLVLRGAWHVAAAVARPIGKGGGRWWRHAARAAPQPRAGRRRDAARQADSTARDGAIATASRQDAARTGNSHTAARLRQAQ